MLTLPDIDQIRKAKDRLSAIRRTPLIRCDLPDLPDLPTEVYLKLENKQITGSFKLRGAGNAVLTAASQGIRRVWTASAGNMGLGVAWYAAQCGLDCTVIVPEDAPRAKIRAIQSHGGSVVELPRQEYWEIQVTHHRDGMAGHFIHPFADREVMAGNGTLALEILEDLPDVEAVIIPYGGGGLTCGVAAALRSLQPDTKIIAAETENGAPLSPSLKAGKRVEVPYWKSFVSGMGSPRVFKEMWPLLQELVHESRVVKLAETAEAIKLLLETHHLAAEGAGAISLAAALFSRIPGKKVVAIITGGNIDLDEIRKILNSYPQEGKPPDLSQ